MLDQPCRRRPDQPRPVAAGPDGARKQGPGVRIPYEGPDFGFTPPPMALVDVETLAVIGTERVGKTAVTEHAARLLARSRRIVVVAMGGAGPPEAETVSCLRPSRRCSSSARRAPRCPRSPRAADRRRRRDGRLPALRGPGGRCRDLERARGVSVAAAPSRARADRRQRRGAAAGRGGPPCAVVSASRPARRGGRSPQRLPCADRRPSSSPWLSPTRRTLRCATRSARTAPAVASSAQSFDRARSSRWPASESRSSAPRRSPAARLGATSRRSHGASVSVSGNLADRARLRDDLEGTEEAFRRRAQGRGDRRRR